MSLTGKEVAQIINLAQNLDCWKKRSRKNDHYENATWIDKANFRRS